MPTYVYINTDTKETIEIVMSISEMEKFEKKNPQMQRDWSAGSASIRGGALNLEPDKGFKELLTKIKKANPGSNLNNF